MYGDFPAKNTVYTPYIPMVLANPGHVWSIFQRSVVTSSSTCSCRVGQNQTCIRCIYGMYGRGITSYTVIYGEYIRFWPTLCMFGITCVSANHKPKHIPRTAYIVSMLINAHFYGFLAAWLPQPLPFHTIHAGW